MRWLGVGVAVVAVAVVVWLARTDERPRSGREVPVVDEPVARAPRAAVEPASAERASRAAPRTRLNKPPTLDRGTLAIAGRVLDSDDGGPVDVTVMVSDAEGHGIWVGSTESPKGQFRIEGLAPGRCYLSVRIGAGGRARGRPPREPQVVEAGDEDVVIRLRPVTWVTYHLIDAATREPVRSQRREVWVRGDERPRAGSSGGGIAMFPMRNWFDRGARLTLRAKAEGYHPTEWIDVQLDPRERQRELTFRLKPDPGSLVDVELLIRDDRGDPVRFTYILRLNEYGGGGGTSYAPEDGRVVLTLPAGKNRLTFGLLKESFRTKRDLYINKVVDLDVKRGEMQTEHIVLQRGGWLRRPKWDGKPLRRNVRVLRDGAEVETEFVFFAHGDYRACLAPDTYVVEATLPDESTLRGEVVIEAGKTTEVDLHAK